MEHKSLLCASDTSTKALSRLARFQRSTPAFTGLNSVSDRDFLILLLPNPRTSPENAVLGDLF